MTLEEQVFQELKKNEYFITTAESCTGGMIAATLINVPGMSSYYKEGYITYSNEAKMKLLQVEAEVLDKYGAVSKQVASQMAEGSAEVADSEVSVASTGIAGPDGGTDQKPVGLVYLSCYVEGKITVTENYFTGDRQEIRRQATEKALQLVLDCLKE